MRKFAQRFIRGRMDGFEKDMEICLAGVPSKSRKGETHAYFPALMSCCGTLEYMTQLFLGRTEACSNKEMILYCRAFMPAGYSADVLRVLRYAFRHPVAHRGIASGVWVDKDRRKAERRITWTISEEQKSPAIEVVECAGLIQRDSPWDCPYTHRTCIHVGQLWRDVRDSAVGETGYAARIAQDDKLVAHFEICMKNMYPKAANG